MRWAHTIRYGAGPVQTGRRVRVAAGSDGGVPPRAGGWRRVPVPVPLGYVPPYPTHDRKVMKPS
jgi:hypothetical protein